MTKPHVVSDDGLTVGDMDGWTPLPRPTPQQRWYTVSVRETPTATRTLSRAYLAVSDADAIAQAREDWGLTNIFTITATLSHV